MDQFFTEQLPDQESIPPGSKKNQLKQFLLELLQTVILSVIIFLVIDAVSSRIRVQSISMQPTLYEKDFVLVNKLAYRFGQPKRGDVIVFRVPINPDGEPYIKRVIGLPGENVRVQEGKVYINNIPQQESYIMAPPNYNGEWTVPLDSVFVLGDNRNSSSDSHQWGMVPLENILGKALVVYYPMEHWQFLNQVTAAAAEP
ncbi:MAG: signal peptidase I [Anaerolineales bacterium]|nr:signal peptidase I [Anaerolineales bacterium]